MSTSTAHAGSPTGPQGHTRCTGHRPGLPFSSQPTKEAGPGARCCCRPASHIACPCALWAPTQAPYPSMNWKSQPGVPGPHAFSGGSPSMPHTPPKHRAGPHLANRGHMVTSPFLGPKTCYPGSDPVAQKQHRHHILGTRPLTAGLPPQRPPFLTLANGEGVISSHRKGEIPSTGDPLDTELTPWPKTNESMTGQ